MELFGIDVFQIINAALLVLVSAGIFFKGDKVIAVVKEVGEAIGVMAASLQDGKISAEEKEKILKELEEAKKAIAALKKKK